MPDNNSQNHKWSLVVLATTLTAVCELIEAVISMLSN